MLKILFSFDGRIGRRNFWLVYLINALLIGAYAWLVLGTLVEKIIEIELARNAHTMTPAEKMELLWPVIQLSLMHLGVFFLLIIFTFITQLAALVKRLHDLNLSGWWALVNFVPVPLALIILSIDPALGPLVLFVNLMPLGLLIFCGFFPGSRFENDYGNDRLSLFAIGVDAGEDWHDRVKTHKRGLRDKQLAAREPEGPVRTRGRAVGSKQSGFGKRGMA